ncbi:MAG: hypothetical protein K8R53_01475 [Bacteroidales bacterium]|nr:hypothetical protein [Bacteroidales bacterium]
MHLYGAWDFHHKSGAPKTIENLMQASYPNSIMAGSSGFPNRIIDPVTAYWIGWAEKLPEWAKTLRPNHY